MASRLTIPNVASLPEYQDRDLGTTDWHTIDQEQIDAFAGWVDAGQPGGSCATASDPLPTQNDLRD